MKMKTLAAVTTLLLSAQGFAHDIGFEHEHVEGGYNVPKLGFISDTDPRAERWNPRGKTKEEIFERVMYLSEMYDLKRTPEQQARAEKAREKYKDAVAINSIMPAAVGVVSNTAKHYAKGLQRNQDAGMTLTSATIVAYNGSVDTDAYDVARRSSHVNKAMDLVEVDTTADIRRAKEDGNMAVMFNSQASDHVISDVEKHAKLSYDAGLRTMNFTYNHDNALAGGSSKQASGLTDFGKKWLKYAQEQGIVIDVSHSSNQTAIEAAKLSNKPIIASHSNAQKLYNVSRNLSDEAILAIGETGGAVCPTGVGIFMNKEGDASPERYVEHLLYVADLIGKDKVCFATDYVHAWEDFLARDVSNTDTYPPELGFQAPMSNIAAENIWDVVAILEDEHGWTEKELKGFLGENLMRVYAANWKK